MAKLGINIDHVATLRQARREDDPDPVRAAKICVKAGADSIVAHLREDRRHIQDRDIRRLRRTIKKRFNLEMSLNPEIVQIALKINPDQVTFVPERRSEITTEGGLDVVRHFTQIKKTVSKFRARKIKVSLFIDPDARQIQKAKESAADMIELHTGKYARAKNKKYELAKLKKAARLGRALGLIVNAGHGLNYQNTKAVAAIPGIHELNIGHSIISHAVFAGLEKAVRQMGKIASRK